MKTILKTFVASLFAFAAIFTASAEEITVSSGGYDYRLYNVDGDFPTCDYAGLAEDFKGVRLPTLPAFIHYNGQSFPLKNGIPDGMSAENES